MKESAKNLQQSWDPEYVGQGVNITFTRIIDSGVTTIRGEIKDGNSEYMGRVELNDRTGKSYVDIQRTDQMRRTTLVALYAKIHECLAFLLRDQITAEDDGTGSQDQEQEEP